ncbi:glycosyltransferase family 4 protein [Acidaminobacter sp. JC074]|uniref:glycosyltransferase family 4 protein n=1 Tax=Acidaminobacter sp. JC074 TaxID=2530199 RepID=UPI001F0F290A|nr:glycosyltransferase family 4 protein [Acidaminobacter sp. JC074]MCH4890653.1 glycosyltransferase family 4 protein [Acidaminobacter sp. JC074]
MKILLLSNMYPSEKHPYYGTFVKTSEDILLDEKHDVKKIVMTKTNNSVIRRIKYLLYYAHIILYLLVVTDRIVYIHYASHSAIPLNMISKMRRKQKIIVNLHGSDVMPENKGQKKLQKHVRKLLNNAFQVVVPSMYYRELVIYRYNLDSEIVNVFPSGGINPSVFNCDIDRNICCDVLQLDKEKIYIGYVGRIDYQKGWDIFLEAISLLDKEKYGDLIRFVVVGSGKENDFFNEKVKKYNLEKVITKYDMLPQQQLRDVYTAIDVLCFPTMRESESLGLVGLEAMACGTPVIGTNNYGLKDYLVDNVNGFSFELGNAKSLADCIDKFLSLDSDDLYFMRENSIKTAERYEIKNISNSLTILFEEVGKGSDI